MLPEKPEEIRIPKNGKVLTLLWETGDEDDTISVESVKQLNTTNGNENDSITTLFPEIRVLIEELGIPPTSEESISEYRERVKGY